MSKLTFLGSGNFFATGGNYHSNMLFESDSGRKLLIDCGSDIKHSLPEAGYSWKDIDSVYVSHMHDDHAGGLEALGFGTHFISKTKPSLICHSSLIDPLWRNKLAISLIPEYEKVNEFKDYFDLYPVTNSFVWESINFDIVPAIHIFNKQVGHLYSFGLLFKVGGKKVYITTDISFPEEKVDKEEWDIDKVINAYKEADIIFHDCEVSDNPSKVHSSYRFLNTYPKGIKNKMWLYHYAKPHEGFAEDGFAGFVKKGQVFDLK